MITDLVQIRSFAAEKRAENLDFRRHLAAHPGGEDQFHDTAREVEAAIDCTQCANCCRETRVEVSTDEIDDIARFLGVTATEVRERYTVLDASGRERTLAQPDGACVFLDGHLCMVYPARPRACHDFPHASLTHHTLGARLSRVWERAAICPIVYNAIELHKRRTGYRPHR